MEETSEINALLNLLEDPDHEVFDTVSTRIVSFGRPIIPNLEQLWEATTDHVVQEKIELLIHRLHFLELQQDFIAYANSPVQELLQGALLVARYQYPDLLSKPVIDEIDKIKRHVWLELNSYLTALEQINIMNRIFYSHYKFKGVEVSYQQPEEFLINKVLEMKRGNTISSAILYQVFCDLLDIPVKAIKIPKQFLLAYFDTSYDYFSPKKENDYNIHFYIDPINGYVYSHKDIENYFQKIGVPMTKSYFQPMEPRQIFQLLLEEFAKCFSTADHLYKQNELTLLAGILDKDVSPK